MNIHPNSIPASVPPAYMDHTDRMRASKAAHLVHRFYPDPVAQVLARELLSWTDMGFRVDQSSLLTRLIDHIHRLSEEAA